MGEKLDPRVKDFVAGVGAITLMWAHVELALDLLVATTANLEGRTDDKHPVPLKAKLGWLTSSLKRNSDIVAPLKGEYLQIISMCSTLADRRNFMVHGAMISTLSEQEITLMKLAKGDSEEALEQKKVSPHEMFVELEMAMEAMSHTYNLVIRLMRENFPEFADHPGLSKSIDVSNFKFPAINARWAERQKNKSDSP